MGQRGELYTTKVFIEAMKKTFFFNVKENRYRDIFLNLVETKKKESGGFNRHSMMIYKEDFNEFTRLLNEYCQAVVGNKELPETELIAQSGKRKYHFITKRNYRGEPYIIISESRKNNDLAFQNESIRIYSEQIQDFQQGYERSMKFVWTQDEQKKNTGE